MVAPGVFGTLPVFDVCHQVVPAEDAAGCIAFRERAQFKPSVRTVRAAKSKVHRYGTFVVRHLQPGGDRPAESLEIVRMDRFHGLPPSGLLSGLPEGLQQLTIHELGLAGRGSRRKEARNSVEHPLQVELIATIVEVGEYAHGCPSPRCRVAVEMMPVSAAGLG